MGFSLYQVQVHIGRMRKLVDEVKLAPEDPDLMHEARIAREQAERMKGDAELESMVEGAIKLTQAARMVQGGTAVRRPVHDISRLLSDLKKAREQLLAVATAACQRRNE